MAKEFRPEIRRARFDRLTIYEISEDELATLARGSPDSVFLNFAIFLLSVAVSFIIALFTTTIEADRLFFVFVIITVIGLISGFVLLAIWWRNRKSVSEIVDAIKKRLPPEGIQEETNPPSSSEGKRDGQS